MARNFIITCGTSQLEDERLEVIGQTLKLTCSLSDIIVSAQDRRYPPQHSAFQDFEQGRDFKALVNAFCDDEVWNNREQFIGNDNNPFGAEISTLIMLAKEGIWQPAADHVTLLSSETHKCVYCTALVAAILMKKAGVESLRISKRIVPKLNENPDKVEETTEHLANLLADAIYEAEDSGLRNVLVVTGGYKSVIPCLTIFSIVFGIEMYYLFEKTNRLQRLNAALVDLSEKESQKFWHKSLEKLNKKADELIKNECLRIAIQARLKKPERPF